MPHPSGVSVHRMIYTLALSFRKATDLMQKQQAFIFHFVAVMH